MPFDVDGARKAGFTDEQIMSELAAAQPKFDVAGAQKSGFTPQQIIGELSQGEPPREPNSIGNLGEHVGAQVNPVTIGKSIGQLVRHPIDTYKNDAEYREQLAAHGKRDLQEGNYADGAVRILNALVPFLGPQVQTAAEHGAKGEYTAMAGDAIGIGLNAAAPKLVGKLAGEIKVPFAEALGEKARGVARKALKPPPTLDPLRVEKAITGMLENKIDVSDAGLDKIGEVQHAANATIDQAVKGGGTLPSVAQRALNYMEEAKKDFAFPKRSNPEPHIAAIEAEKKAFAKNLEQPDGSLRDMTAEEAQTLKKGTYEELRSSRGTYELSTAQKAAKGGMARAMKDSLNEAFPDKVPGSNKTLGEMAELEPLVERELARHANRPTFKLGPLLAGGITGGATGSKAVGAIAGVMKAVTDNPVFKSKVAHALYKASKGGVSLPTAKLRVAAWADAVSQGADKGNSVSRVAADTSASPDALPMVSDLTDAAKRKAGFDPNVRLQEYAKP